MADLPQQGATTGFGGILCVGNEVRNNNSLHKTLY